MRTLEKRLTVLEGGLPDRHAFNLDGLTDAELERLLAIIAADEAGQPLAMSVADQHIIARIQPGAST